MQGAWRHLLLCPRPRWSLARIQPRGTGPTQKGRRTMRPAEVQERWEQRQRRCRDVAMVGCKRVMHAGPASAGPCERHYRAAQGVPHGPVAGQREKAGGPHRCHGRVCTGYAAPWMAPASYSAAATGKASAANSRIRQSSTDVRHWHRTAARSAGRRTYAIPAPRPRCPPGTWQSQCSLRQASDCVRSPAQPTAAATD
jgi:hypothetical protein